MKKLRSNLKRLMLQKQLDTGRDLDQKTVAEETGLSRQTINQWHSGNIQFFKSETVEVLCDYFGCDVNELLVLTELPEGEAQ